MAEKPSRHVERVLVTCGSGFLGAHIVEQLLADPAMVVAIISRNPRALVDVANDRLSTFSADIASETKVQTIFDTFKPQVVIHTVSPKYTDTAALCATRAFIYTSSDSAVEPSEEPLTEDRAKLYDEHHYPNPYSMSKALADAAVHAANCDDLYTAVIRVPGIYGERDNSFIPQLVASVRKKEHQMQVGQNK